LCTCLHTPNIRVRRQFVYVIIRSACEEPSFNLNKRPVLCSVEVDLWQRHSVCYATRNVGISVGMQVPLMFLLSRKRLVIKESKLSIVAFGQQIPVMAHGIVAASVLSQSGPAPLTEEGRHFNNARVSLSSHSAPMSRRAGRPVGCRGIVIQHGEK